MSMHGGLIARAKPKEAFIKATITRADGSVEELGTISFYHRNPLRRALWRFGQLVRKFR